MTRVDLITGFLGAGKTTFIQRYLRRLEIRRGVLVIIGQELDDVALAGLFPRSPER